MKMTKTRAAAIVSAVIFLSCLHARGDEIVEQHPGVENVRKHENVEWSVSYAYHLSDASKDLPRIFLVGDSICKGYQDKVRKKLEGSAAVTYWASSYCVTSSNFLRFLEVYLDEAEYAVVHFNNGLHSLRSDIVDYTNMLSAAFSLIKNKCPRAKIVWASSTPLNTDDTTNSAKVIALNAAADKLVSGISGVATNDLFALMNPLDRFTYWNDVCHYKDVGYELLASQVVEKVAAEMRRDLPLGTHN